MLCVRRLFLECLVLAGWFAQASAALAVPAVWTGFDFSFSKPNDADFMLPQNQDRITDNVWLTRAVQEGLFNIRLEEETGYEPGSPADTEWATDLNSVGEEIAAENWANLTFESWVEAYQGEGTMNLPFLLTSRNAVLHLITDDIYLDIQFTAWTSNAAGGGFSYNRAVAPAGPTTTGDYNDNGVVDAADYVLWRDTLTQAAVPPGSGADGNESGEIDPGDYDYWRARFGNVVPPGAGAAAAAVVPEPSTIVILLGELGLLVLFQRIFSMRAGANAFESIARGGFNETVFVRGRRGCCGLVGDDR